MKNLKKILALIMCVVVSVTTLAQVGIMAYAQDYEYKCGPSVKWSMDDETCTLTLSGTGITEDFNSTDPEWKEFKDEIKNVVIDEGITHLGNKLFLEHKNLKQVTLPSTLETLGDDVFNGCSSIKNITLPDSIKKIGKRAFNECVSLNEINLPDKLEVMGSNAFCHTQLTDVTIPGSLTKLENGVFAYTKLISVNILDGVKEICPFAFAYSELESATLSNSVEVIGRRAFAYTNLNTIDIGNNLNSIGLGCFSSTGIKKIVLPDTVKEIGTLAFEFCDNLEEVVLSNNLTVINEKTFYRCRSLSKINVPEKLEQIGESAFEFCDKLTNLNIPNTVTTIDKRAFYGCDAIKELSIPSSVATVGSSAFTSCMGLTDVYIDANVLNDYAFSNCRSIKYLRFGNNVKNLGENSFANNLALEEVTIPKNVLRIGSKTFDECNSLKLITIKNPNCSIGENAIPSETAINADKSSTAYTYAVNNNNFFNHSASNHKYDNGVVTKKATCETTGIRTYTCTICGDTKVEEIAKKPHDYVKYEKYASLLYDGEFSEECCICGKVKSLKRIPKISEVKLSTEIYSYNGKAKKPTVKVVDANGKTISASNYTVSYAKGRTNVGKYSVKVTFKGNYSGSKTLYFTIKPSATSIVSLSAKTKGFVVKWNKRTKQTTGYQIQYSTSNKFNNPKTYTISKNSTTSKGFYKLSAKKKYFVRVRTYKVVDGKKYYSAWSSAKSVRTK